ncbi:hypothetical protein ACG94M_21405 [Acinetobacter guillouiae]|uniref:hypothetical protein n=1 Tax=Acinetobacter guillouiae TaxID=106649 RepID=UPI003AF58863
MMVSKTYSNFLVYLMAFFGFCLFTESVSAQSNQYKIYKSKLLQCGEATFQVISQCDDSNEGAESGSAGPFRASCLSSQLAVNWKGQQKILNFPMATAQQKKILASKGYALTPVMKVGDWSPQSLACGQAAGISGHFVVINQATTNNINQEYHGKGSLSDEPVLLNLNGTFTSEKLKAKIYALLKQDQVKISKVIGANAIFTDEK